LTIAVLPRSIQVLAAHPLAASVQAGAGRIQCEATSGENGHAAISATARASVVVEHAYPCADRRYDDPASGTGYSVGIRHVRRLHSVGSAMDKVKPLRRGA